MSYLMQYDWYIMCETDDFPGTSVASEMPLLVTTDIKLVDPSTEQVGSFQWWDQDPILKHSDIVNDNLFSKHLMIRAQMLSGGTQRTATGWDWFILGSFIPFTSDGTGYYFKPIFFIIFQTRWGWLSAVAQRFPSLLPRMRPLITRVQRTMPKTRRKILQLNMYEYNQPNISIHLTE